MAAPTSSGFFSAAQLRGSGDYTGRVTPTHQLFHPHANSLQHAAPGHLQQIQAGVPLMPLVVGSPATPQPRPAHILSPAMSAAMCQHITGAMDGSGNVTMNTPDAGDAAHMGAAPPLVDEGDESVPNKSKTGISKKAWTPEEDKILAQIVEQHGAQKWSTVASYLPGRVGKQCRERWFNHLSGDVKKGQWTEEEDRAIMDMVAKYGTHWSQIVKYMPGRTDNAIKNRYNSAIRKQNRLAARAATQQAAPASASATGSKASDVMEAPAADSAAPAGDALASSGAEASARPAAHMSPKPKHHKGAAPAKALKADGTLASQAPLSVNALDVLALGAPPPPAASGAAAGVKKRKRAAGSAGLGADAQGPAAKDSSKRIALLATQLASCSEDTEERRTLILRMMQEMSQSDVAPQPSPSPAPGVPMGSDMLDPHLRGAWQAFLGDGCPSAKHDSTFDLSAFGMPSASAPCSARKLGGDALPVAVERDAPPAPTSSVDEGLDMLACGHRTGTALTTPPPLHLGGGGAGVPDIRLSPMHTEQGRAPDTATAAREILANFDLLSTRRCAPASLAPPGAHAEAEPATSHQQDWFATYSSFPQQGAKGSSARVPSAKGASDIAPSPPPSALTPSHLGDFLIDAF